MQKQQTPSAINTGGLLTNQSTKTIQQANYTAHEPHAPIYPTAWSLAGRCLAKVLAGQVIDTHSFEAKTGSQRVAASIHDLWARKRWPIMRVRVPKQVFDPARRKTVIRTFTKYGLPHDAIQVQGERGQAFIESVARYEKGADQ